MKKRGNSKHSKVSKQPTTEAMRSIAEQRAPKAFMRMINKISLKLIHAISLLSFPSRFFLVFHLLFFCSLQKKRELQYPLRTIFAIQSISIYSAFQIDTQTSVRFFSSPLSEPSRSLARSTPKIGQQYIFNNIVYVLMN